MGSKKEIFADGIGKINYNAGVVRFDYVTLQPAAGQKDVTSTAVQIVMPVQGFLRALDSYSKLINQMLSAGILTASEIKEDAPTAKAAPAKRGRKKKTAAAE